MSYPVEPRILSPVSMGVVHSPPQSVKREWQTLIQQADWYWRGWQVRYAFTPCSNPTLNNPPFLLVHGFGAAIGHWRHNIEALSQHAPVYAIDLLGYGHSQKAATGYGVPLWCDQLEAFWQQFLQTPVVLVGNSLGSLVSLNFTAAHPDWVADLILLNLPDASVLQAKWPKGLQVAIAHVSKLFSPMNQWVVQSCTAPWIFNPFFNWIRHPSRIRFWAKQAYTNPTCVDQELVDILGQPPYDLGAARALVAMTRSPQAAQSATTLLPQLNLPILLVWGKDDRLVPASLAPMFKAYNSRLKVVELERVGHCPHDECPNVINRMILEWVA
jgi:pimeloyl-ACP methyl ester carboxylesterase